MFLFAAASFVTLFFVPAPYGRHRRPGWGPEMNARTAWILMESPSVWLFLIVYLQGQAAFQTAPLVLLGLWQLHYVQRTLVFPLLMRGGAPKPLLTVALAFGFNLLNSSLNASAISWEASPYPPGWLVEPRFLVGVALFVTGFAINIHADAVLRGLRRPGESGYRIPHGGLFRWVTSPNYLGELIEWTGFALAAWSLPALAFALFTAANLVPRAWAHHRWYQEKFPDYPSERRAILPGIF
jgi:protein-S-isoprenylcysteine O-methyltransferase Ste14